MRDYKTKSHQGKPNSVAAFGVVSKSIYLFQGVLSSGSLNEVRLAKGGPVFVCEGRPSLEAGRRLSEIFLKKGITPTMISDNMAGFLFFKGLVKEVIIACQYADKKGALCDMGALILAVLAKKHGTPLKLLEAERRHRFLGDPRSILSFEGQKIAPENTHGYVPLVEWVPAKYLK